MIADFLLHGSENAVSQRQLAVWLGTDTRTVRIMIQRERLHGTPILADNQTGYYLPASQSERDTFVRSMRGRAAEILRTAEAVEAAKLEVVDDGE